MGLAVLVVVAMFDLGLRIYTRCFCRNIVADSGDVCVDLDERFIFKLRYIMFNKIIKTSCLVEILQLRRTILNDIFWRTYLLHYLIVYWYLSYINK